MTSIKIALDPPPRKLSDYKLQTNNRKQGIFWLLTFRNTSLQQCTYPHKNDKAHGEWQRDLTTLGPPRSPPIQHSCYTRIGQSKKKEKKKKAHQIQYRWCILTFKCIFWESLGLKENKNIQIFHLPQFYHFNHLEKISSDYQIPDCDSGLLNISVKTACSSTCTAKCQAILGHI